MLKKIFITILLTFPVCLHSGQNEIQISEFAVSEISASEYFLNYQIKNTFDKESYSDLNVVIPIEKYIIQGTIENGIIKEKDFLFSQFNLDLNNNSEVSDSFKINISNNKLSIDNKKISPLLKSTSRYQVLIPYDDSGNFNVNRISDKGIQFTLKNFSSPPPEITIGFNKTGDIEFKTYPNNMLLIELIKSGNNTGESLRIDSQKPFIGFTSERELTGGEIINRFTAAKNIIFSDSICKGSIKLENIQKPFTVRITYYFTISKNLILFYQKTVKVI